MNETVKKTKRSLFPALFFVIFIMGLAHGGVDVIFDSIRSYRENEKTETFLKDNPIFKDIPKEQRKDLIEQVNNKVVEIGLTKESATRNFFICGFIIRQTEMLEAFCAPHNATPQKYISTFKKTFAPALQITDSTKEHFPEVIKIAKRYYKSADLYEKDLIETSRLWQNKGPTDIVPLMSREQYCNLYDLYPEEMIGNIINTIKITHPDYLPYMISVE